MHRFHNVAAPSLDTNCSRQDDCTPSSTQDASSQSLLSPLTSSTGALPLSLDTPTLSPLTLPLTSKSAPPLLLQQARPRTRLRRTIPAPSPRAQETSIAHAWRLGIIEDVQCLAGDARIGRVGSNSADLACQAHHQPDRQTKLDDALGCGVSRMESVCHPRAAQAARMRGPADQPHGVVPRVRKRLMQPNSLWPTSRRAKLVSNASVPLQLLPILRPDHAHLQTRASKW